MANVRKILEAMNLVVELHPKVLDEYFYAEHDILYLPVSTSDVPADSPLGIKLDELGAHIENEESWAFFT